MFTLLIFFIIAWASMSIAGLPHFLSVAYATTADSTISNGSAAIGLIGNGSEPTVGTAAPQSYDISGYILDSKGNKVPHAFVTLYKDGSILFTKGNPTFSDDGNKGKYGWYYFTGLAPGNYTMTAEIVGEIGTKYNGTAAVKRPNDAPSVVDITIKGYVFKPWINPTPVLTPIPTAVPIMATQKPQVTAVPTASSGISWMAYIIAPIPVAALGLLAVVQIRKRTSKKPLPKAKQVNPQFNDSNTRHATTGYVVDVDPKKARQAKSMSLRPQLLYTDDEYTKEIENLVRDIAEGYGDIAVLNKVNEIAKKYYIDQNTIFYDIKKVKGRK